MKLQIKAAALFLTGVVILTGCGGYSAGNDLTTVSGSSVSGASVSGAGVETEIETNVEDGDQYCMTISIGSENQVSIPDPAVPGEAQISLNKEAKHLWRELSKEQRGLYFTDLSFAGFHEPVLVTSYAVGYMTKQDGSEAHIVYEDSDKMKVRKGNCLALFVSEGVSVESETEMYGDEDSEVRNYVLVLDYAKQTYYKKETGMFLHGISSWCTMKFADLTGDGKQELFMKHVYNKSVDFGVWQSEKGTHELNRLYCTLGDDRQADSDSNGDYEYDMDCFTAELLDGYKVKLEYKDIGYSQTVSMIDDGGYKERDLQVSESEEWEPVALWKNGILQKNLVDKDTVFPYTLDHVGIVNGKNGKSKVELVRGIYVGHRSCSIGNMHIFMKYDKKSKKLILDSVRYVTEAEARKELKTFDEWKDDF